MRRRVDDSSSFDLFLDTICNTFGGVVFLAILLAIMIQNRSVVRTINQSGQHATPDQLRKLIIHLDTLTAERSVLQATLKSLPPPKHAQADGAYIALAERLERVESDLTQAVAVQNRLASELAEQLASNATMKRQNDSVPVALAGTQRDLAEAKAKFQALLASKQQTLRLPRVRTGDASSALLLVQEDTVYLARTPTVFGRGFNAAQVTTASTFDGGIRVDPLPGKGWPLGTPQTQSEFQRVLQQARSGGYSLTLAVWPESYEDFVVLREAMITADVDYQLWPQSQSEPLIVYLGTGRTTVQ